MADNIKKFFKANSNQFLSATDLDNLGNAVESAEYVDAFTTDRSRFIPPVDFDDPENFAKFGSAKDYYTNTVTRIYKTYPYDGSGAEKLDYHNSSSYLDRWIYKSRYPKSTGYININTAPDNTWAGIYNPDIKEYISFVGGPGTGSTALSGKPLAENFAGTNVYDAAKDRESNLKFDWSDKGNTVEFWLKLGEIPISDNPQQVIFDMGNGYALSSSAGPYGRLMIYYLENVSADNPLTGFYANWASGSAAATEALYTVGDGLAYANTGSWNHYAFSFKNETPGVRLKTYQNGKLVNNTRTSTSAIGNVTGSLKATLGAVSEYFTGAPGGLTTTTGWHKISGSIDEFRYWKGERNVEEVGKYWFTQVDGGSNSDDANTNLGVYYKFNEGITENSEIDSVALDYSGRVTNGTWTGYNSTYSRNTGSAIVSASASPFEIENPIIYPSHPNVSSLLTVLADSGSAYDRTNNSSIYNSIPDWIVSEDDSTLLKLTQIMSSYLDSLYLQIEHLPKMKDVQYAQGQDFKPVPYAGNLLDSAGFVSPEIFVESNALEQLASRTESLLFEEKLHNIKNLIYQNIYNNLVYIYKSKGTEKAFRNLVRCYGIGDDLVRLNIYADNATYNYEDNFESTAIKKRVIDFNATGSFDATVYQHSSSNANSVSFVSGGTESIYIPRTIESNIFFPKKLEINQEGYFDTPFVTASLFGVHTARSGEPATTTYAVPDRANFQVFAIRDQLDSNSVRFKLTSSTASGIPELTTSLFEEVYDNQSWNISVRIKPAKYPVADFTAGTGTSSIPPTSDAFDVEFAGYNNILDITYNSFALSGTMTNSALAKSFLSSSHRVYAGAHLTNFTGTVQQRTDVRLENTRYWMDYLQEEELKAHARDSLNYGRKHPQRDAYPLISSVLRIRVPQKDTLALNWDYQEVTSSDSAGKFLVADFSSGSINYKNQKYGFLGNILESAHPGFGYNFVASNKKVVDIEYRITAKQSLPENVNSSDMVQILDNDDVTFTRETRPIRHFFAFEKSMYDTISHEMLDMFSTVKAFSNLVGNPVNRYRDRYKDLTKLRSLFFERIGNTPSLEKYVEFYKWIDSSLGLMLNQLVPASADFADNVRNLVESHVLERSKYKTKFPTLEHNINEIESAIDGVGDAIADAFGGFLSPLPEGADDERPENIHCPFWGRTAFVPGLTGDASRQGIVDAKIQKITRQDGSPVKFGAKIGNVIHGGINFSTDKNLGYAIQETKFQSSDAAVSVPADSLLSSSCLDSTALEETTKVAYQADTLTAPAGTKGSTATPFNLVEDQAGSVSGDYNSIIRSGFATNVIVTNLHGEQKEIPMQGPFTDTWVGGRQFRHAEITVTPGEADAGQKRPEAWRLDVNAGTNRIEFRDPVLGPLSATKGNARSKLFREVRAKRPVNIKNIQYTSDSARIGNYNKNYEIVSTNGRTTNNFAFVQAGGYSQTTPENYFLQHPEGPIAGTLNFALPDQALEDGTHTKTVIANHFNAPGGKDVSSRGVLNPSSEEYAAGNALPWRNRSVRLSQQENLTTHTGQFGTYPYNQYGLRFRMGADSVEPPYGEPAALAINEGYANPAGHLGLSAASDFSISFWMRTAILPDGGLFHTRGTIFAVDFAAADTEVFAIWITPSGRVAFYDGSNERSDASSANVNDNEWHHWVVTYSSGDIEIYKDGIDVTPATATVSLTFSSDDKVSIGGRYRFGVSYLLYHYLGADLDELSVWTKALTSTDVGLIYNGRYPNNIKELGITDLQAWYRMGDDIAVWYDSAKNNHAKIRSGAGVGRPAIVTDVLPSAPVATLVAAQEGSRNFVKRLILPSPSSDVSTAITGVIADNAYITHPIPRSDTQYRWIRDSYQSTDVFGHAIDEDDITFVEIGEISSLETLGVYSNNLVYETIWAHEVLAPADDLNPGTFRDGLQLGRQVLSSFSPAEFPSPLAGYANTSLGTPPSPSAGIFSPDYFNILMTSRNGLSGFSTWKQTRTGDHPITRYLTANNYYTYMGNTLVVDGSPYKGKTAKGLIEYNWPSSLQTKNITNHKEYTYFAIEPGVTYNGNPMTVEYIDVASGRTHNSSFSFVNALETFANNSLVVNSNIQQKVPESYKVFLEGFTEATKLKLKKLSLRNIIYPRSVNATLAKVRGRLHYDETIAEVTPATYGQQRLQWRDLLDNRLRNPVPTVSLPLTCSLGIDTFYRTYVGAAAAAIDLPSRTTTGASSIYPLDPISLTDASDDYKAGELLQDTRLSIGITDTGTGTNISEPSQTYWLSGTGDATQHPGGPPTFAPRYPTTDSYEDFSDNIRRTGAGYTVIPEFRISEHMDYYISNGFFAENNAFLTGEGFGTPATLAGLGGQAGADISKSAASETSPYDSLFMSTYVHTDFMKYFGQVKSDYSDLAAPSKIALKCDVIKKLLPYQGFYPVNRCVQLGTMFETSHGSFITGSSPGTYAAGSQNRDFLAAATQPLFGPGLLYNSIKAGHATDWPLYTTEPTFEGTWTSMTNLLWARDPSKKLNVLKTAPNTRLKFEDLLLGGYPLKQRMFMLRRKISGSVGSFDSYRKVAGELTQLGSDDYVLAMSNFLAASSEFFLERPFNTFHSKERSRWGGMKEGVTYYMDVSMYKTADMVQAEGPRETGTQRWTSGSPYGFMMANWTPGAGSAQIEQDPLYAAYTPCWFYHKETVTIAVTADSVDQLMPMSLDKLEATASLLFGMQDQDVGRNTPELITGAGILYENRTKVTATVDLFERTRRQNISYDAAGQAIEISEGDSDKTDLDVWTIATKGEFPTLNFSGSRPPDVARGMWSYGDSLPTNKQGIYVAIEEHPAVITAPDGKGSLIDICGFDTTPRKIGEIAAKKDIFEAIVAIPFTEVKSGKNKGDRRFIKINKNILKQQMNNKSKTGYALPDEKKIDTSITSMMKNIQNYVMPPHLDFIKNKFVDPFVVYLFEFKQTLNRDDLANIWQGVQPDISLTPESDSACLAHELEKTEFFHGKPLPPDLRWVVFKVKQRASNNYFNAKRRAIDKDNRITNAQGKEREYDFSYNWPHDFCSLVELAKIEAGVELQSIEDDEN